METEPSGLSIYKYKEAMKKTYEIIRNEVMYYSFPTGSYPIDKKEYFHCNMDSAWLAFITLAGQDDGLHYYFWKTKRKELEDYWNGLLTEGLEMIKDTQGEIFRPKIFRFISLLVALLSASR